MALYGTWSFGLRFIASVYFSIAAGYLPCGDEGRAVGGGVVCVGG